MLLDTLALQVRIRASFVDFIGLIFWSLVILPVLIYVIKKYKMPFSDYMLVIMSSLFATEFIYLALLPLPP